jgi:ketosteroid isomerase-like protein
MGREDVELVARLQALITETEDLKRRLDDDTLRDSLGELIDPEAEFRFMDVEGGALGDFRVPTTGVEGLRAGWTDWIEPWEEFGLVFDRSIDAGDGKVVLLAEMRGKVRGGVEVSQPGAAVIRIREGLIVGMDFYLDRRQACRAAGLD